MSDGMKTFFIVVGVLATIYILFRYLLPLVFKALVWAVGVFFYIALAALIIGGLIWLIANISQSTK